MAHTAASRSRRPNMLAFSSRRARTTRLRWVEISTVLVLLLVSGVSVVRMVQDISAGRVLSQGPWGLWGWVAPIILALALLSLLILRRINLLWSDRLKAVEPELRRSLARNFALVGLVPTALMLTLAIAYFSIGFSGWIDRTFDRVLANQNALAEGYVEDLKNRVGDSVSSMAQDIQAILQERPGLGLIERFMQERADLGGYWHLYLYDATGAPLLRYGPGQSFDPIIPGAAFRESSQALSGRLILDQAEDFTQVKVLVPVPTTVPPVFVYGAQLVDTAFTRSAESARDARTQLTKIEGRLRLTFFVVTALLILIALVLLIAATLLGLWFANRLLDPIGNIIAAAKDMGEGALDVRVPVSDRQFAEFQALSNAFNTMAGRLERQRADLRAANVQIEQRSQFTTAVLTGVSAGVIGMGARYEVTLPNRAASDLLGIDFGQHLGEDMRQILPEFKGLLTQVKRSKGSIRGHEIKMFQKTTGKLLILLASAIAERTEGEVVGFVLTFDDVSELASAQRQSAWSEVARRIAHEIKNPLTPIQLSTERLKRRFSTVIPIDERDVFALCLDTILKQVETISRMVSEFSSFSRMPAANLAEMDLAQVVRQAHFLQAARFERQDWQITLPEVPVWIQGDSALLTQAIQNLIKNAGEAAQTRVDPQQRKVWIDLKVDEAGQACLAIRDTGPGFRADLLSKIGEPYVSTKKGGTGLGLAIVQKIMEDHGAGFSPANQEKGGAILTLTFPPLSKT